MMELELKAVVDDLATRRASVERAGGILTMEGLLHDRRYDTTDGALARRDDVLRVRSFLSHDAREATVSLEWKGPVQTTGGYKQREEIGTNAADGAALTAILGRLGYVVTKRIDRRIAQYELLGATVRFETYPRMDVLVEVEGEPDAIERAIAAIGIARSEYTAEALAAFVRRFERRTGATAAVCDEEPARDGDNGGMADGQ